MAREKHNTLCETLGSIFQKSQVQFHRGSAALALRFVEIVIGLPYNGHILVRNLPSPTLSVALLSPRSDRHGAVARLAEPAAGGDQRRAPFHPAGDLGQHLSNHYLVAKWFYYAIVATLFVFLAGRIVRNLSAGVHSVHELAHKRRGA